MNNNTNMRFDIKAFLSYLRTKMKFFIIVIVIGLVLGGAFGVFKQYRNSQISSSDSSQQAINTARAALSKEEIKKVDSSFIIYKDYINQVNKLKDYENTSIYLNLTSSGVGKKYIYYVSGNNINVLSDSIKELVVDNSLLTTINSDLKKNNIKTISYDDLLDLIQISDSETQKDSSVVESSTSLKALVIKIYATNEKQLNIITSCFNKSLQSNFTKLKSKYKSWTFTRISTSNIKPDSDSITSKKNDIANRIQGDMSAISSLQNSFTENQTNYFNALLAGESASNTSNVNTGTSISVKAIIKTVIIVEIVLILLYLCVLFTKFIFSGIIYSSDEISEVYHLPVIYELDNDVNKAINEVNYYLEKHNENCGMISLVNDEDSMKLADSLAETNSITLLHKYPEAKNDYQVLNTIKNILVIVRIGSTKTKDLEKLINYYRQKDINVDGVVAIKK